MSDTTPALSIFDICETDVSAEENGRWFRDVFNDGTNIDIKLRRLSSKASLAVRRRLDKAYRKHLKPGTNNYPDDIALELINKQMAEAVIIDWAGILDRDGQPIVYSPETAYALLTKLPAFRDVVAALAANLDNWRVQEQSDAAKN